MTMTRAEHLEWCKQRAYAEIEAGNLEDAFASMASDLGKHEGTAKHSGIMIGMMMIAAQQLNTADEMRRFIDGFN